jgi:predicted nucleic acid-binding protein
VILDTNALSAVADDEPAVVRVYRQAASMELPVIVLGEYRFGIGQSRRRGEYEKWLRELIGVTRVLVVEEEKLPTLPYSAGQSRQELSFVVAIPHNWRAAEKL